MLEPAELVRALGNPKAPGAIWQEPFDHDVGHYRRLCDPSVRPSNMDLISYVNDYEYMPNTQADLLRFLLPRLLKAWGEELLGRASDYGGFAEHCLAAFAKKPLHPAFLGEREFRATADYVGALILECMRQEKSLQHRGMHASPYKWFYALGSYTVVFPYLRYLWESWWQLEKQPDALCAVQYLSCLLYDDDSNPVFAPWTRTEGGGPPCLWEVDGHIYEQSACPENVEFLRSTLTTTYVREKLAQALDVVTQPENRKVIERIVADFQARLPLLQAKLAALPSALAQPRQNVLSWADVL